MEIAFRPKKKGGGQGKKKPTTPLRQAQTSLEAFGGRLVI